MPLPNTAYAKPMLIQAIIEDVIALASVGIVTSLHWVEMGQTSFLPYLYRPRHGGLRTNEVCQPASLQLSCIRFLGCLFHTLSIWNLN